MVHWQVWEVSKILENVRISEYGLLCQNIYAMQSLLLWKAKRSPTTERRKGKVLRQIFSMETRQRQMGSYTKLQCVIPSPPCDFQKRSPLPLSIESFGDRGSLFESHWKLLLNSCWFLTFSISPEAILLKLT